MCPTLTYFAACEDGAVTVDWVVLTGALVGLALAVIAVISGGAASQSGGMDTSLRGVTIQTAFGRMAALFGDDFSGGANGWIGGTLADLDGFGEVLMIEGGGYAEVEVDLPAGAATATIAFDLIGGDDLNGEPARIFVNGQEVAIYADRHGRITTGDNGVDGITVSMTQTYSNDPVGAGTHGHDSRASYLITVENPGARLSFGVQSDADQPTSNEFYAIDDVSIDAT